jgi:hypothetical protein
VTRTDAGAGGVKAGDAGPPLFVVIAQLMCISLALTWLDILPETYRLLVVASFGAVVVHHFLPEAHRLTFFVGLGIASVFFVAGTSIHGDESRGWSAVTALTNGVPILAVGLLLIAICRLKVSFWLRVGLLVLVGTGVALARQGAVDMGAARMAWVVLAGLFALRLAIFLYDVSTMKTPPGWRDSLAYFLALPNACSPVFPALDFKTFCRSRFAEAPRQLYQRGIERMIRGMLQLVFLRYVWLIYLPPERVYSGKTLLVSLLTESLLYLWVSGHFHFATGMLHLFGFKLPETHVRYFLAEDFTDYWRRTNVYFRDFMLKVFYYPMLFRLKRFGMAVGLVLAVLWVFAVSWAVHLSQVWWLEGRNGFTWPDATFWIILGILVATNALWEFLRGGRGAARQPTMRDHVTVCLKTAATFAIITVLFSMMKAPSFDVWVGMWQYADLDAAGGAVVLLVGLAAAKVGLEILPGSAAGAALLARWRPERVVAAASLALMLLLPALAGPADALGRRLPELDYRISPRVVASLVEDGASAPEPIVELQERDEARRQLDEVLDGRRLSPGGGAGSSVMAVQDYRLHRLRPSLSNEPAFGTTISTNALGMRDDPVADPAETRTRLALLGADDVMGWGVPVEQTFASRLEVLLADRSGPAIDVLNFGVYGYGTLGQVAVLEHQAGATKPRAVVVVGRLDDGPRSAHALQTYLRRYRSVPDPALANLLAEVGVTPDTRYPVAARRLAPVEPRLLRWSFERLVAGARNLGSVVVYVYLPQARDLAAGSVQLARAEAMMAAASDAGMHVIDLSGDLRESGVPLTTGTRPELSAAGHAEVAALLARRLTALLNLTGAVAD